MKYLKQLTDLLGLKTKIEIIDGWGGDEKRLVYINRKKKTNPVPEMDETFCRLLIKKLKLKKK